MVQASAKDLLHDCHGWSCCFGIPQKVPSSERFEFEAAGLLFL